MTFHARSLGKECLKLSVKHYPFTKNGQWESPQCGLALLNEGWHRAADLYAEHMRKHFIAPDVPEWMREEFHGWVEIEMKREGEPPKLYYRDLPKVFEQIMKTGINAMNIAGWMGRGHDTLFPDFFYNPELGTHNELKSALLEIKAMGCCPILYTNGRIVDVESDYFKNKGENTICLDEHGKPYLESYNTTSTFAVACPGCAPYISHMAYITDNIIREYGAGAMMVDQISCNIAHFCYDESHDHATPSTNFLHGVEKEMSAIRNVHKAMDKEFFIWCEGCHERFGQFYDVNQGHGEEFTWQIGESLPEQFLYTFPNRLVTGHCYNIQQLIHSFVQGKPMDIKWNCFTQEGAHTLIKDFTNLRKSYPQYFLRGIFRDNVDLHTSHGAKVYGILREDSRGMLVNLWCQGADLTQLSQCFIKVPSFWCNFKAIYPSELKMTSAGQWLEIEWVGPVASILFE